MTHGGAVEADDIAPARRAGILLHITSLPGPYGIGDLGYEADHFIEFLRSAGHHLWQILPLAPPGAGNSPYAARSTFAGNPLLISPDLLIADGLLDGAGIGSAPQASGERIDWPAVAAANGRTLRRAFERFRTWTTRDEFERFRDEASGWLPDYTLFMALREAHGDRTWLEWPMPLRRREPVALELARHELRDEIEFHAFVQWQFFRQWARLKERARAAGVQIIGDIPIFVDHDSADTWANQAFFQLGDDGEPLAVAGVPPDYFSATGQRWGNPLYRWAVLKEHGYQWWVERLRWTLREVDMVRLDHFRGFVAAWEIPSDRPATEGDWVPGPCGDLFAALHDALGTLPLIVEDLGLITPDVIALRNQLALPGMKVLQFAFGDTAKNPYLPHNIERRAVVYTGTHDNDTTAGWLRTIPAEVLHNLQRYLGSSAAPRVEDLLRLAYESVADIAIVPMQDALGLGSEARMNVPGEADGNWGWRLSWDQVDSGCAARLRDLAELSGRC